MSFDYLSGRLGLHQRLSVALVVDVRRIEDIGGLGCST